MNTQCTCVGGSWGVTVCWHCHVSGDEAAFATRKATVDQSANTFESTDNESNTSKHDYEAMLLAEEEAMRQAEESKAAMLAEARRIAWEENGMAEFYEELWDNLGEYERLNETGWPYSDDD